MDDRLLNAALEAAQQYGPVFPLVPNAKAPAVKDWEQRATTDLDRIRRCWSTGPYNIGLATGRAGRVVVDLDTAKPDEIPPAGLEGVRHGAEVLAMLAQDHGADVPTTRTVFTPSDGRHLYFKAGGRDYRNTAGRLGWHIDTRAHGGYVVAPGSIVNGRRYELADSTAEVELPEWLAVLLTPTPPQPPKPPVRLACTDKRGRYLAAAIAAEVARVDGAPRGQRNEALYMAAQNLGQLVAGGELTEQEVRDALMHAAASYIAVNSMRIHKAAGSITSGLKAGARRPRKVAA
ncbi:bifunctional DNA primase/polymerase [Lentzea californiensis]|uniref:bifunctional DNA primase/polymerase n=1 Tax=Lentzea californiensis TaxID=438851 RepID=UPI00216489D2|nr:bifunctional DNA primase/polymerase [Lentzea californiensis]MCR3746664.1 Bifunctional DNA primase/polymerase, N-terminal [Lentzea californiensis]